MQETLLTDTVIVGAGPIGLEVAYAMQRAGVDYLHFDQSQIASTIAWFPEGMTFFSSADRIAIAGIPLSIAGRPKATKEEYLAYLRGVALARGLPVQTYQRVTSIVREPQGGFVVKTCTTRTTGDSEDASSAAHAGGFIVHARHIVLATGDMAGPRRLNIPGEDLPHVSHYFHSPHAYFRQRLLVVGGKNSAAETALRCYQNGARVAMSYRGEAFNDKSIKYWILPEITGCVRSGQIACHFRTMPVAITPTHVTLARINEARTPGETFDVPADFVLLMTGYVADSSLLRMAGARCEEGSDTPVFNEQTMETTVAGLFVAGTATAGTQRGFKVFIENCHIHAARIAAAITGSSAPPPPATNDQPES